MNRQGMDRVDSVPLRQYVDFAASGSYPDRFSGKAKNPKFAGLLRDRTGVAQKLDHRMLSFRGQRGSKNRLAPCAGTNLLD